MPSASKRGKYRLNRHKPDNVVYSHTTLPGGIRLISEELPGMESFALGVCVNAGSRDEPVELAGMAHFLEHAVYRQTRKKTSRQIASKFEAMGAYTNAFTTKETTCFYVRALNEHFLKSLRLLLELSLSPKFTDKDIAKEKKVILEEIRSYEDDPEEMIFDYTDRGLFGDTPMGQPITGYVKTVEKISASLIEEFHENNYTSDEIIITLAGSLHHDKALNAINSALEDYSLNNIPRIRKTPHIIENGEFTLKKTVQQSHIVLGRSVPGIGSDDRYPLALISVMLGDGMSSRLYHRLRERNGLAYSVYSSYTPYTDCGTFTVYAACEETAQRKSLNLLREEISKMFTRPVSVREIMRAKEQLKSGIIMELEDLSVRMQSIAKSEFYLGGYEEIGDIIRKIESISLETIHQTADKYFNPDDWSLFLIEPES